MPSKHFPAIALILNLAFCASAVDAQPAAIASFATSIEDQEESVQFNIRLACSRLNGFVIPPKSVFSFNDTVGEGSIQNGYRSGAVLYRDEVRYEPGGGLCQVSSTLFNALLTAGCSITERHRHFQPVTYVPPGLDATIKYGKKDLRMRNPYEQKLYIEAIADGKSLLIRIRADAPLAYRYELVAEEEQADHPIEGDGRRLRGGITVNVYRNKYSGDQFIESFLLYRDFYPAVFLR